MFQPYLVIAHFKSEVARSTNHCNFKIVAKSKNENFLTHYFTTSPGEGGCRGMAHEPKLWKRKLLT